MYTASISWFIGLLFSICSISISCSVLVYLTATFLCDVLVTFSFRMSSSLTTPSTIRLLPASRTKTFHYKDGNLSMIVLGFRTGTAYFSASCRPHSLKNDYNIRIEYRVTSVSSYLLSCCNAIADVPMLAVGLIF